MLRLDSVSKRYGRLVALEGLSLTVERGEILGLLGPNGAGKSTAASIATGLTGPDAGEVDVDGVGPPTGRDARRRIGLCPQTVALYHGLTARENLELFAGLHGMPRRRARRRADDLLRTVGLLDRARSSVASLSGGMQRRLNLAAALVHEPAIVLLDEPTAGVDPHSRAAIFELVETLRDRGAAVVYTTHYMEEAQRLCDRVGIIDRGRLLALGTVEELTAAHGGASIVTVDRGGRRERTETETPLDVVAGLDLRDGVTGLHIQPPSLESVFMNLTGRSLRDDDPPATGHPRSAVDARPASTPPAGAPRSPEGIGA